MTITRAQRDEWRALAENGHYGTGPGDDIELADALAKVLDALDQAERAAHTFAKVVADQCRDIALITRSDHLVDEDGDADWGLIWERGYALMDRLEKAETERDEADAALDRVKALHSIHEADGEKTCWHCNHPEEGMWGSVPHPCPTIRAIEGDQE